MDLGCRLVRGWEGGKQLDLCCRLRHSQHQGGLASKGDKWGHLGGCQVQVSRRPLMAQVSLCLSICDKPTAVSPLCQYRRPSGVDFLQALSILQLQHNENNHVSTLAQTIYVVCQLVIATSSRQNVTHPLVPGMSPVPWSLFLLPRADLYQISPPLHRFKTHPPQKRDVVKKSLRGKKTGR